MQPPILTAGHSNHSLPEFVELLHQAQVERIIDIRTLPGSRSYPQFNLENLTLSLPANNISYEHVPALGGLRGRGARLSPTINGFWTNKSFHNYADYALSEEFKKGLEHLLCEADKQRCAIMCSEAVWWRCHRRIVADYLMARGRTVYHIMGKGKLDLARLTPSAAIQPDGTIFYAAIQEPEL